MKDAKALLGRRGEGGDLRYPQQSQVWNTVVSVELSEIFSQSKETSDCIRPILFESPNTFSIGSDLCPAPGFDSVFANCGAALFAKDLRIGNHP